MGGIRDGRQLKSILFRLQSFHRSHPFVDVAERATSALSAETSGRHLASDTCYLGGSSGRLGHSTALKNLRDFKTSGRGLCSSPRAEHPIPRAAGAAGGRAFHASAAVGAKADFYEVLGVARDASGADIKKAYYKLAKECHPDMNKSDPQAEKKFQAIQQAYETLKDDEKRAMYDQVGPDAFENAQAAYGQGQGWGGGGGAPGGRFAGFGAEEIFGSMGGASTLEDIIERFAGRRDGRQPTEISVTLTFREAVEGVTKTLRFEAAARCTQCNGKGSAKGERPDPCRTCGGSGRLAVRQGFFQVEQQCWNCKGRGSVIKNPCRGCGGTGLKDTVKEVQVTFPPGVDSGLRMQVEGRGAEGPRGAPPGDLVVHIEVLADPVFKREGLNVHLTIPITFSQAALGANVRVPTLTGEVALKVRPGTQPGTKAVLRGKGIKALSGPGYGDQYVHYSLAVPTSLSKRQRELLEELAREESGGDAENEEREAAGQ